jgi:hypothetical protein
MNAASVFSLSLQKWSHASQCGALILTAIAGALQSQSLIAQGSAVRFSGRVITADSARIPIISANIQVVRGPDRSAFETTTGASGEWEVQVPTGGTDFVVTVVALGYQQVRRRVGSEGQRVYRIDFALRPSASQLDRVTVRATRRPPVAAIDVAAAAVVGIQDDAPAGIVGALSALDAGSVDAIARTAPTFSSDGSLLGTGANLVTVNGMAISARQIPRGMTGVSVTSRNTAYDVGSGGFAGANVRVNLAAGSLDFTSVNANVALSPGAASFADAVAVELGARPSVLQLGASRAGAVYSGRMLINTGVQFSRSQSRVPSLFESGENILALRGLLVDSVARLATILRQNGAPLTGLGDRSVRNQDEIIALARFDRRPTPGASKRSLVAQISASRDGALSTGVETAASQVRRGQDVSAALSAESEYNLGKARQALGQLRVALSVGANRSIAREFGPSLLVNLASSESGSGTSVDARIGGNANDSERNLRLELMNDISHSWGASSLAHLSKLHLWSRFDQSRVTPLNAPFGAWRFNSLGDLNANRPSFYARRDEQIAYASTVWNGAIGVGDTWRVSRALTINLGVRLEAWSALTTPSAIAPVQLALAVRTDQRPAGFALSPRVGFRLRVGSAERSSDPTTGQSVFGRAIRSRLGLLSGGFGLFRGTLNPTELSDALVRGANGLPVSELRCAGDRAPALDWTLFTDDPPAAPLNCLLISTSTTDGGLSTTILRRDVQPPASWRSNIQYALTTPLGVLRVEGLANFGFNQWDRVQINFRDSSRSVLAGEGSRPLFVAIDQIDTRTGVVRDANARLTTTLGSVTDWRSDLRSRGAQLVLGVDPNFGAESRVFFGATYVLSRVQSEQRGYGTGGFGSPNTIAWAPAPADARHRLQLSLGSRFRAPRSSSLLLTSLVRIESGLPFTPLVAGDVSGAGAARDRAYLPTPTENPDLANAVRSLIETAPRYVATCLQRYQGSVPPRGACRGPWSARMSLQLSYIFPSHADLGQSPWRLSLNVVNPLAGVDRVINGARLRGWGQPYAPDPVLLLPRGFDVRAQRFDYQVNSRFGDSRPQAGTLRNPITVVLDVSRALGARRSVQQFSNVVRRDPKTGRTPTTDAIVAKLTAYMASENPYAIILEDSDWLLLSPTQIGAAELGDSLVKQGIRTAILPLADSISSGRLNVSAQRATESMIVAKKRAYEVYWESAMAATALLTPVQRTALSAYQQGMLSSGAKRIYVFAF